MLRVLHSWSVWSVRNCLPAIFLVTQAMALPHKCLELIHPAHEKISRKILVVTQRNRPVYGRPTQRGWPPRNMSYSWAAEIISDRQLITLDRQRFSSAHPLWPAETPINNPNRVLGGAWLTTQVDHLAITWSPFDRHGLPSKLRFTTQNHPLGAPRICPHYQNSNYFMIINSKGIISHGHRNSHRARLDVYLWHRAA